MLLTHLPESYVVMLTVTKQCGYIWLNVSVEQQVCGEGKRHRSADCETHSQAVWCESLFV